MDATVYDPSCGSGSLLPHGSTTGRRVKGGDAALSGTVRRWLAVSDLIDGRSHVPAPHLSDGQLPVRAADARVPGLAEASVDDVYAGAHSARRHRPREMAVHPVHGAA